MADETETRRPPAWVALLEGREARRTKVGPIELRETTSGLTLTGYASVTGAAYDMGPYMETISRGAFKKTLSERPDVQLLINHDGLPLARTTTGTLRLSEDDRGLRVEADVDPDDPDVRRLVPKMRSGNVDEMSFAFRAVKQDWNDDWTSREIREVSIDRGDVSVVSYGANPATSVTFRDMTDALLEVRDGKTLSAKTMTTLEQVLGLVAGGRDNTSNAHDVLSELIGANTIVDDEQQEQDQQNNGEHILALARLRARHAQSRSTTDLSRSLAATTGAL